MEIEKQSEPDSTTLEKDVRQQFRKDEDVLCLNSKDGCFYLGTIVQVFVNYYQCKRVHPLNCDLKKTIYESTCISFIANELWQTSLQLC